MNRTHYLFLGLFLFVLIHLPTHWTDLWRSQAAAVAAPVFCSLAPGGTRGAFQRGLDAPALRAQVDALHEWLTEDGRLHQL